MEKNSLIMLHKRFYVRVVLQLHAVTCPGVWLCSHGYLEVTIKTLGYYFRTGAMDPRFPLLCHDQFVMEGYFRGVESLEEMKDLLNTEQLEITLWQNGRRLAYYVGKLAQVMQPTLPRLSCAHTTNVQLLMKATPAFPGILAPKVELSAQLATEDRQQKCSQSLEEKSRRWEKSCSSCQSQKAKQTSKLLDPDAQRLEAGRRKQQKVCHSKSRTTCSCTTTSTPSAMTNQERRLSNCSSLLSSNSQTLSQMSSILSDCSHCRTPRNADEHQQCCDICQAYRQMFST